MPQYTVQYAYQVLGADAKPEDERWGFGRIPITTDVEPQTAEEFKEIARTIGLTGGYEKVVIQSINEPRNVTVAEDDDTVIEGTIVDDSE